MFEAVRRLVRRRRGHCECRHCGTTVEHPRGGCPTCDSCEIACYDV